MTGIDGYYDIVIIGGGPAGMSAALGARQAGAERILLLERDRILGGILNQCIHDGFGLYLFKEALSGPEFAERLIDQLLDESITCETEAMVLDLTSDRTIRYNSPRGYRSIQAGAVILAMGCRERTRGMIDIPGTRPAGVFTAGCAQGLVNMQNLKIGNKAVILGSGDIGLIMARRLTLEGMKVSAVYELLPWCNGLDRNVRQCLYDYDIPLHLSTTVTEIHGNDRLEAVTISEVDQSLKPVAGTEKIVPCDTLLLSVGLIPENELSLKAGVSLSPITGGAEVDEYFMTSIHGIFSCGNVLHINDLADNAAEEGFMAGANAAFFAAGKSFGNHESFSKIKPGDGIRYCLPQNISVDNKKGIELSFRTGSPMTNREVELKEKGTGRIVCKQFFSKLLPSEQLKIKLPAELPAGDMELICHE